VSHLQLIDQRLVYGHKESVLQMTSALHLINEHGITASQFLFNLLSRDFVNHSATQDLLDHLDELFGVLLNWQ
jgi:hypothetical protein